MPLDTFLHEVALAITEARHRYLLIQDRQQGHYFLALITLFGDNMQTSEA